MKSKSIEEVIQFKLDTLESEYTKKEAELKKLKIKITSLIDAREQVENLGIQVSRA